jgi:hypothetical protein
MISDPVADTILFVDLDSNSTKKLQVAQVRAQGAQLLRTPDLQKGSCPLPAAPQPTWRSQPIGDKFVEGQACQGELILLGSEGVTVESWLSPQLSVCIIYKETSDDVQVLYRLFNIQLTEPDPSLFLVSG